MLALPKKDGEGVGVASPPISAVIKAELPHPGVPGRNLSGTNLERAGEHNQRVTLHAIRVRGPVTRTDLAQTTGLTASAIANITKRLLKCRMILEAGTTRGSRGQPATKLVVNPECCYSLGLNIDRDHITLVLVDFVGRVQARTSCEVRFALPDAVQAFFAQSVGPLLDRAGIDPAQLVGVGVALPDDIQRAGLPEQPAAYSAWGRVAIDTLLGATLPVPILVENDAAAAAMGEMQLGLGHQYQSFFYVLITATLGGGLVIDGQHFRGAAGRSGELGLLQQRELDGGSQSLQNIVSLSALYRDLATQGERVTAPSDLLRLGDPAQRVVAAWIETVAEALEDTLVRINCLINPEAILIGGRLPAQLVERLVGCINERMHRHVGRIPWVAPVVRAALSDDAPAVGAAVLPISARFLPMRGALMSNVAYTARAAPRPRTKPADAPRRARRLRRSRLLQ